MSWLLAIFAMGVAGAIVIVAFREAAERPPSDDQPPGSDHPIDYPETRPRGRR